MRNFIATLAALAISILPATVSAQIDPSIGATGGICWENMSGTVTCRDMEANAPLGNYTYGAGNGGLSSFENFLAYGDDSVPNVQIRDLNDNSTCVVQGTGNGLSGTATYLYATHYYQDKLVKVARDFSDCVSPTNISLTGRHPIAINKIGNILYVLNEGSLTSDPTIDEVDTTNGDLISSHTFGAVFTNDVKDMVYEPSIDSFIVTHDSGLWAVSRSTWTKTSWGDLTIPMGAIDYLDGYISVASLGDMTGYIINTGTPNADQPVSLTIALKTALGYSSTGLTTFFMDGTGLYSYYMTGIQASQISTDVGDVTRVDPWVSQTCNNGTREGTEECDTSDLGSSTCQTEGYVGGTLSCTASCTLDTSSCNMCGNNVRNVGEACDGNDFNGETCFLQGFVGGTLSCTSSCTIDTSACHNCGNGALDSGEQCDGADLGGNTCLSQGFTGGSLGCDSSCNFDVTQCTINTCGNAQIDPGEQCDSGTLNGQTCESLGFAGGTLSCTPGACTFNTSGCTMCGNGVLDGAEQCDATNLDGQTCLSRGFTGGTLACAADCNFDTSSCEMSTCGNGVVDTGEECDDNNQTNNDGCSSNCQVEQGYECYGNPSTCELLCGNGRLDDGEECDRQDFGSATCTDFSYDSGTLSCTSSCTIDTSSCLACNQDGLVQELGSGDFDASSQLQGELMTKYEEVTSSLQSQPLEASCEQEVEIFGAQVPGIIIPVDDQHYVHFRVETEDFVVDRLFFSYYGAAELAVSTENPLEQEIYGDGDVIFIHSGENITVKRGWNATGTVGTIAGIFSSTYNRRQKVDGWFWEIVPQTDMVKPFEFGNELNTITIGTDDTGLPYYLDKANAQDISVIGRKPNTGGKGGCNQANCSQSNGATSLGVMFGILMLWLLMGVRRSRRSAQSRIKENDRKSR